MEKPLRFIKDVALLTDRRFSGGFTRVVVCHICLEAQAVARMHDAVLVCTDEAVLPFSQVFDAIKELGNDGVEQCDPLVLTRALSLILKTNPMKTYILSRAASLLCSSVSFILGEVAKGQNN